MYEITVHNLDTVRRRLATNLRTPIEAGAAAIAHAIQDVLAPYPPPRPRYPGRAYYVRGLGMYSASGMLLKPSEQLGQRWAIQSMRFGARLVNTASYSTLVHGDPAAHEGQGQRSLHARTGWVREDTAIQSVREKRYLPGLMADALMTAIEDA